MSTFEERQAERLALPWWAAVCNMLGTIGSVGLGMSVSFGFGLKFVNESNTTALVALFLIGYSLTMVFMMVANTIMYFIPPLRRAFSGKEKNPQVKFKEAQEGLIKPIVVAFGVGCTLLVVSKIIS